MAYVATFGDQRIPVCLATVEFLPTEKGTGLILTHQGAFFEGARRVRGKVINGTGAGFRTSTARRPSRGR
jgi:hypothetical protein